MSQPARAGLQTHFSLCRRRGAQPAFRIDQRWYRASSLSRLPQPPIPNSLRQPISPRQPMTRTRRSSAFAPKFNSQLPPHMRTLGSTSPLPSSKTDPAPAKRFNYAVAASYSGKRTNFKPHTHHFTFSPTQNTRFRSGVALPTVIPSAGRLASGQDAVFISNVGTPSTGSIAFGVADGVSGWQDQGIDSAAFAHGLCGYMEEGAKWWQGSSSQTSPSRSSSSQSSPELDPLTPDALLKLGYTRVCADRSIQGGGSTACICILSPTGHLSVANLGDSGFMQLRGRKVHYYSDPQTHAFNTPYQLSHTPPKLLAQMQAFGQGAPFSDSPADASVTGHGVGHGDVLVVATDGVWDNLSSQDLLGVVCRRMEGEGAWVVEDEDGNGGTGTRGDLRALTDEKSEKSLQMLLATDVVKAAKDAGLNSRRDGPFARAVQKAFPMEGYTGGKPDDIGVVVAIAIDEAAEEGKSRHVQSKL